MNALANKYADSGVGSIFIYTCEAHPGENYPPLVDMAQKADHANALRDDRGITRPIYLDGLAGPCHREYGGLPNMTWIFNTAGVVLYKAEWTGVESVENAILFFLDVVQRRKSGEKVVGFQVERMDFRNRDSEEFLRVLKLAGPRAVQDFADTFGEGWAT